ncbi:MAG: hypothetical protein ACKO86_12745, partial [Dolichospermum sp.]
MLICVHNADTSRIGKKGELLLGLCTQINTVSITALCSKLIAAFKSPLHSKPHNHQQVLLL